MLPHQVAVGLYYQTSRIQVAADYVYQDWGSGTFSRPRQRAYFNFTSMSEAALMPLGRAFPLTATTADTRPG